MREFFGVRGLPPLGLLAALAIAGCATSGPATEVAAGSGAVTMRAGDFVFAPDVLQVKGPRALTLQITNDLPVPTRRMSLDRLHRRGDLAERALLLPL